MNTFELRIHRTWVQLLIDHNYKEAAAIAIDSELLINRESEHLLYEDGHPDDPEAWYTRDFIQLNIAIPSSMYSVVKQTESLKNILERGLSAVIDVQILQIENNYIGPTSYTVSKENLEFAYRIKLLSPDKDWENVIRHLIAESDLSNQGTIAQLAMRKRDKSPLTYNEMRFASQSEIRIAQELEKRKVLFFPLAMAVRADTGDFYKDHREPDFLICVDGLFGVLEVSYHPDRYELDAEKSKWFKKSGILCVENVPAEKCYQEPEKVVDEFLEVLAKHKR
jgi:hypothetical protein